MSFVGNKIQHFRNEKKITIEELSQQTGIGIEQLKRIEENADLPALSILLKIARVLGLRLGTLLDDLDNLGPAVSNTGCAEVSFSTNSARWHGTKPTGTWSRLPSKYLLLKKTNMNSHRTKAKSLSS